MKLLDNSSVRGGVELAQDASFSVTLTQGGSAKNLQPMGTSPQLWAERQKLLSPEDVKLRQCKLGELCWLAAVSRPDICARLARIASRIDTGWLALLDIGVDVYRINDLVTTVKKWQPATVLKYVSSGKLDQGALAQRHGDVRHRKERINGNAIALAGWSDAAYEDQSSMGKCRLGYVIGLMSPNLRGPCHIIHWTSKFTRKLVVSSLGGQVYALSEMLDHVSMLREFYGHLADLYPGMVGLED